MPTSPTFWDTWAGEWQVRAQPGQLATYDPTQNLKSKKGRPFNLLAWTLAPPDSDSHRTLHGTPV